jgi:hypothetical protein
MKRIILFLLGLIHPSLIVLREDEDPAPIANQLDTSGMTKEERFRFVSA